ncbi:hypothetical protein [Pseudomonas aeruginosa]|uniref:hypothetical protein n=1 Tax=Pseudomonas aeruginosa TaxID=287 RepID=UPI000F5207FF|nr:hypothetical protein [Pseudomonas aeruginosa]RQH75777.1 hypothetical protein IPC25_29490 [Pseudomonas aeruginosa]
MPIARIATLSDYVPYQHDGRTLYRIRWEDALCPGSPTDNPADGLPAYNAHQIAVAAGKPTLFDVFDDAIEWCLAGESVDAQQLASDIVKHHSRGTDIPLGIDQTQGTTVSRNFRFAVAFLKDQIRSLPPSKILALRGVAAGIK